MNGYHPYRGTGSGGSAGGGGPRSILITLALALVLTVSLGYLAVQNNVVYDSQGSASLELPFLTIHLPFLDQEAPPPPEGPVDPQPGGEQQPPAPPQDDGSLNLVIDPQDPESIGVLRGREVGLYQFQQGARPEGECNGLVMELKADGGRLYYQSATAAETALDAGAISQEELTALLAGERDWTAVAALHCFHDTPYAFANMAAAGICQSSGYIWYDISNTHWLEPSKAGTLDYFTALVRECAGMGFDEVVLRGLGYPTKGKLDKIDSHNRTGTKEAALETFLTSLREAVGDEILISLEFNEALVLAGADAEAGQSMRRLLPLADRLYVDTDDPNAVWAAIAEFLPEGAERESYLVVIGASGAGRGSCLLAG